MRSQQIIIPTFPKRVSKTGKSRPAVKPSTDSPRVELHKSQRAESSALGSALCGALGNGWYSSLDEIAALGEIEARAIDYDQYLPIMEERTAHLNLRGWRQATERVLWEAGEDPPIKNSPPPPHSRTSPRRLSEELL